ncbi:MAG: hypothetical protein M0R47_16905 [Methylobacter sp.]|uniref:hypothetical protein n=1 Tax=Methylobacter sp. TaxID=2051955 RepID=UPI0026011F48|nr:hypothetical protein [Methylobacter sp.]MCK9622203.1 hypothetical protein [Methylobacter sp.]
MSYVPPDSDVYTFTFIDDPYTPPDSDAYHFDMALDDTPHDPAGFDLIFSSFFQFGL